MTRYYVDTNIWIDYFEDRSDGLRPLGEWAHLFFSKCLESQAIIVVSNEVQKELERFYTQEQISTRFSTFESIILRVTSTREQQLEAKRLVDFFPGSHRADIVHALIARQEKCILITRDKGFISLSKIAQIAKPEEISSY